MFPVHVLFLHVPFPSSEPFICSSKQLLRNLKSLKSDDHPMITLAPSFLDQEPEAQLPRAARAAAAVALEVDPAPAVVLEVDPAPAVVLEVIPAPAVALVVIRM